MKLALSRLGGMFLLLFNRRWWWSTLLIIMVMLAMIRLGFWQLARGEQRRVRNEHIVRQMAFDSLPLSDLNMELIDLEQLLYRVVTVDGTYDYTQQIILHGQKFLGQPGVNIVTPLVLPTSDQAVLVNRGWIPYGTAMSADLSEFDEPGLHYVSGRVRLSDPGQAYAVATPTAGLEWYRIDITALQGQITYNLLPIYLQQMPHDNDRHDFPKRVALDVELNDGPHLGYAIQWFLFVPILGGGYLHSLRKTVAPC